jgi:hypothetical protein
MLIVRAGFQAPDIQLPVSTSTTSSSNSTATSTFSDNTFGLPLPIASDFLVVGIIALPFIRRFRKA